MSNDRPSESSRSSTGRSVLRVGTRLFADLLIVALWVVFVTLLVLTTGWPWWAFYAVLILGIGGYVLFTAGWG